jgi:hypothetical protein
MRNAIQRFMYGRYGNDQFGFFLLGLSVVLSLLASLFDLGLLNLLAEVAIIYALFRMFSRNTYKRREENAKFLRKVNPFLKWFRLQQTMRKDKAHRYFKCPNCSQYLRVPRGKGKITVTCRSCKASFQEKS